MTKSSKKRRLEEKEADHELQEFRRNLPVHQFRKELLQTISRREVTLVVAETGSGKSTQIPSYLMDLPSTPRIVVTQPRRVAAVTLAQRVAAEHGSAVGKQIGYRVRFDDCTCSDTQLVYATDGMLLREAMVDPLLSRYSYVFLDESHERSLQTDILVGVVERARNARKSRRNPLHVVLMSATLEIAIFQEFYGKDKVGIIQIPGRTFPVQLLYSQEPVDDYLEAALSTVVSIHENEEAGDVLVFLPGQEEIEDLSNLLKQYLEEEQANQWTGDRVESMQTPSAANLVNGVLICPLYAALPPDVQMVAFADKPSNCTRKIILATNIAETSVTLPDIRYVVDTGKHKCRQVLSASGMEALRIENVSQAQAAQRSGRAGRVQAGFCFRLYTEDAFCQLPESSVPEILRVNLSQVVLQLKGMGIKDPTAFEFVTPPERESLLRAVRLLFALRALDEQMDLTNYGKKLAKLPLDPVFGHLLLQSAEHSCTREMLTAVSVLSAENLFYRPFSGSEATGRGLAGKAAAAHHRFASHEGDLPTFLNVYNAWQKEAVYVPSSAGGRSVQKKLIKQRNGGNLVHGDWCRQNFISGRALVRAFNVRAQLRRLCSRPLEQNGLGMEVDMSCGKDRKAFLKCVAAGLFLQCASRIKHEDVEGSGRLVSSRGRYRTKVGKENVSIHPTSTLFNRQPAPLCVVYSELVTTKRTYIRGVTQIREEWLQEVAPDFYSH